jgi:ribonucleoside-diphosphate reductase beta chain
MTPGLLIPSKTYKPFRYPWAFEFWQRQQQIHWLPEEVPLGDDVNDWNNNLTQEEKNLLTQIFRFFTQSDVEVNDNYMERYSRVFVPTEIKMMLASFSSMETVHIAAYAHLLETIGMPEAEFAAFLDYEEMRAKHEYMNTFTIKNRTEIVKTVAMFGAFTEGLQLFASFAMLLNFPRLNKMKGMGQIVTWSVRDESLHCEGMIKLYHTFVREIGGIDDKTKDEIVQMCLKVVEMEDRFIDLAFRLGAVQGMTPLDIKNYIRYIADWRLRQLELPPIFGIKEHPLPWLALMLNGVEHANFFEARATEYSKGATKGEWHGENGVWANFDSFMKKRTDFSVSSAA